MYLIEGIRIYDFFTAFESRYKSTWHGEDTLIIISPLAPIKYEDITPYF